MRGRRVHFNPNHVDVPLRRQPQVELERHHAPAELFDQAEAGMTAGHRRRIRRPRMLAWPRRFESFRGAVSSLPPASSACVQSGGKGRVAVGIPADRAIRSTSRPTRLPFGRRDLVRAAGVRPRRSSHRPHKSLIGRIATISDTRLRRLGAFASMRSATSRFASSNTAPAVVSRTILRSSAATSFGSQRSTVIRVTGVTGSCVNTSSNLSTLTSAAANARKPTPSCTCTSAVMSA